MSSDFADGGVHTLTMGSSELNTILSEAARRSQVRQLSPGRRPLRPAVQRAVMHAVPGCLQGLPPHCQQGLPPHCQRARPCTPQGSGMGEGKPAPPVYYVTASSALLLPPAQANCLPCCHPSRSRLHALRLGIPPP